MPPTDCAASAIAAASAAMAAVQASARFGTRREGQPHGRERAKRDPQAELIAVLEEAERPVADVPRLPRRGGTGARRRTSRKPAGRRCLDQAERQTGRAGQREGFERTGAAPPRRRSTGGRAATAGPSSRQGRGSRASRPGHRLAHRSRAAQATGTRATSARRPRPAAGAAARRGRRRGRRAWPRPARPRPWSAACRKAAPARRSSTGIRPPPNLRENARPAARPSRRETPPTPQPPAAARRTSRATRARIRHTRCRCS